MSSFLPTIIFRHRKENGKKCTLKPIQSCLDVQFYRYPLLTFPSLENYFILSMEAPLLTKEDQGKSVCLIDGSWKYAAKMQEFLLYRYPSSPMRSLPKECQTAYPRKQTACTDPKRGLASIEALFFAYLILGKKNDTLLDGYYWKNSFLLMNQQLINSF